MWNFNFEPIELLLVPEVGAVFFSSQETACWLFKFVVTNDEIQLKGSQNHSRALDFCILIFASDDPRVQLSTDLVCFLYRLITIKERYGFSLARIIMHTNDFALLDCNETIKGAYDISDQLYSWIINSHGAPTDCRVNQFSV